MGSEFLINRCVDAAMSMQGMEVLKEVQQQRWGTTEFGHDIENRVWRVDYGVTLGTRCVRAYFYDVERSTLCRYA